ncbi:hypothetical protein D3C78_1557030 [compost metagenome]
MMPGALSSELSRMLSTTLRSTACARCSPCTLAAMLRGMAKPLASLASTLSATRPACSEASWLPCSTAAS